MRTCKRMLSLIVVCTACLVLTPVQGWAQGTRPLPPLPASSVINKVITETNGPTRTSLGIPSAVVTALRALKSTLFAGLAQKLDAERAVYYFSLDTGLSSIALPLSGDADGSLQPDAETPDDQLPAKVVGMTFQPGQGVVVLVAVWTVTGNNRKPADIRFYSGDAQLPDSSSYQTFTRKLKGTRNGQPGAGDQGVIVAARETCFSIGLDQVCYALKKFKRDERVASVAEETLNTLSAVYDFQTKFDVDGALPEILGASQRTQCKSNLAQASAFTAQALTDCTANLVFSSADKIVPGGPIGLFRVLQEADVKAYDDSGNLIGKLPAGSYIVLDATPDSARQEPGSPGALFLVSASGGANYLIPSQVVEGFGSTDDPDANARRGQAGIKDGFIGGQGF
jgi:hypothetical protein